MKKSLKIFVKHFVLLLGIAVVALSCSNDERDSYKTTTLKFYIEDLEPDAMTSCNYASNVDLGKYDLRLKLWLCKRIKSGYEYSSFEFYSDSPIINVDKIPREGEYFLFGWADYTMPQGDDLHYVTSMTYDPKLYIDMPANIVQSEFALNDESYAAYAISAYIKDGKLMDSDGKLNRVATKLRIVTEDEELAAKVATVEIDHGTIAVGLDLHTMNNNLFKDIVQTGEKASYPNEPRCLATTYVMINNRSQHYSIERLLSITLKDENGVVLMHYPEIYVAIDNDLLTTIVLPNDSRGEVKYYLSAYNNECAY